MDDRVPCKNPGCSHTILPSTAAKTGGFCMPCVHAAAREERAEYIKRNRHDVNAFDGVTDIVEILKIVHTPRTYDPLVNWLPYPTPTDQLYAALATRDQQRLEEHAAYLIGVERKDEAEDIIVCLAAFTDAGLGDCLRALVSRGRFWPSLPFRKASSELRDELIERVHKEPANHIVCRNQILQALAWIGDSTVVRLFEQWKREPPSWTASLHIPPQDYAREAGWELTEDGQRRQLYFQSCTKLVKGESQSPRHFRAIVDRDDECPWCNHKLTNLFTVTPSAFDLTTAGGWAGSLQVTTCEVCTPYGTVFGFVKQDGSGSWSLANTRPRYLPEDSSEWVRLPQDQLTRGPRRPPMCAANRFLPTRFSQVGGHPTWIQDAEYPVCPGCLQTMVFLAQISNEDIDEFSEGIYYAFVCFACRTTATTYQQS